MREPWGISGPEFLSLYLVALIIALVWTRSVRLRLRRTPGWQPPQPLTVDEFAYLAGGPRRVVEASIARSLESGALRLNRSGMLRATGRTAGSAVDSAVLADCDGYRMSARLLTRVAQREAARSCGERLAELGLIVPPDLARAQTRRALIPLLVLGLVGVVRCVNGIALGRPASWLVLLLVLTGVAAFLASRRPTLLRTVLGDQVLEQARTKERTVDRVDSGDIAVLAGTAALAGAAGLVAFGGLSAFPDPQIAASLRSHVSKSASSSGEGGCSGGSGGGGGTGCGDGGGGCGSGGGCGG